MSGTKINNYSQLDSNILELQLTSDQSFKGKHQVSLTNYDNTSLPAVAAGSVIEVNGALYKFASEEAITGSPSDGTVYIYIDPATITAVFTNTAPTWSDSKQGWYGTTTTANCRYVAVLWKASTTYYFKHLVTARDIELRYLITIAGSATIGSVSHGISSAFTNKRIVDLNAIRLNNDYNMYSAINAMAVTDTTITVTVVSAVGNDTYAYIYVKYR